MARGRTITDEGGVAAQTPAIVGKNGGEKVTGTVAVARIVIATTRNGTTGPAVGVEVGTEPRGPDTKTDGGAGAGLDVVARIMKSSPDSNLYTANCSFYTALRRCSGFHGDVEERA
jgi:hypothetical protein